MPIPTTLLGSATDNDVLEQLQKDDPQRDLFSGNVDWSAAQTPPPDNVPLTPTGALNPFLIPDGFAYNARLKYLAYRSFPMFLRMLDEYRQLAATSAVWQPRWYPVPQAPGVLVPAGDQYYYQQRMAQGSIIWGYSFFCNPTAGVSIHDMRVALMDDNNQYELTSGASNNKFVQANAYRPNFTGTGPGTGFSVVIASEPYRMFGSAPLLDVTLVNTSNEDALAQLLIMVLEPGGYPQ
jgi:hypothetical protein